jgi:hypothetical protein
MKQLKFYACLLAFSVFIKVGYSSFVNSDYFFEELRTYSGVLEHSEDKKTLFLNTDNETIELEFAFDEAEDLIVDEWGKVMVSGYYSRVHQTLLVEEISGKVVTFL